METKVLFKLIKEVVSVVTISSIFGAGTGWLGGFVASNYPLMAEGDAMLGVVWLVTWGTLSYYILLRKYLTLENLSGLMVLSALISMIPAIIFHISTPVITSFLIILGSLYIWRTGSKKSKLEKEN
jgi:hypothetical protein